VNRRKGYEFPSSIKEEARRLVGYRCERCGRKGTTEAHHIIPIHLGREIPWIGQAVITSLANVEILCPHCHEIADQEAENMTREQVEELARSVVGVARMAS